MALLGLERTALAAGKVRLYKSTLVPTELTPVADFVTAEADFNGYAGVTLGTWSAVGIDSEQQAQAVSADAFFQATDALAPNLIGGGWLETSTGVLYEYFTYPVPVPMNVALNFIALNWHIRQPGPGFVDEEH